MHDCDAQLFSGDYDLNSNATLPSLWTASGFRYFHFATWIVAHPLLALWPFQCYFGQGMFWTLKSLRPFAGVWEGLATLSFVLIALLWFMLIVGFNSTTNDASAGWWIFSTFIITDISVRTLSRGADMPSTCTSHQLLHNCDIILENSMYFLASRVR